MGAGPHGSVRENFEAEFCQGSSAGSSQINTNQFKNGNDIDVEGVVFKIVEFQHVKPGKGGAFVRTKLRRSSDGALD